MTLAECGLYWNICALQYAKNAEAIEVEEARRLFNDRNFDRILNRLLTLRKLTAEGPLICCRRVAEELQRARKRASDATLAASKRWENKENEYAAASNGAIPTIINQQASINNHQETRASPRASMNGEAFDRWWEDYPEKVGKGAARKAFAKALAKTSVDQLVAGVERYKATKPQDRAWCNPATWLNQERWTDQPDPPALKSTFGAPGFA